MDPLELEKHSLPRYGKVTSFSLVFCCKLALFFFVRTLCFHCSYWQHIFTHLFHKFFMNSLPVARHHYMTLYVIGYPHALIMQFRWETIATWLYI